MLWSFSRLLGSDAFLADRIDVRRETRGESVDEHLCRIGRYTLLGRTLPPRFSDPDTDRLANSSSSLIPSRVMPSSSAMTICLSERAAELNTLAGVCGVVGDNGERESELANDGIGDM